MVVEGFLKNGLVFLILKDLVVPYIVLILLIAILQFCISIANNPCLNLKTATSFAHSVLFPPVISG